ncbi:hypothetical protein [Sphingobium yanoikuyae]|uniref:hypothetical protein n=1 Tax=Sphingobium yanoikuyae TaxID=13690 RepID=UPI0028DC6DA5|nr:hypothetical protein [Sphingobium yanoikuyae]
MRDCYLPVFLILAGCGSEKQMTSSNNAAPHDEPAPVVAPSQIAPAFNAPPSDFEMPDFAPRYPGSVLVSVDSGDAGKNRNHEVRLTTTDDAAAIMTFYRERFAAGGMRKTSDFLSGGSGMMSATGKGRKASIAIARERDHQAIIVTYSGE